MDICFEVMTEKITKWFSLHENRNCSRELMLLATYLTGSFCRTPEPCSDSLEFCYSLGKTIFLDMSEKAAWSELLSEKVCEKVGVFFKGRDSIL